MKPSITSIVNLPAIEAAPLLLGCRLRRRTSLGLVELKIVETEAYHQDDPASHSFRGMTNRTRPMFESGGLIYVYFTYGKHFCINVVTGSKGRGEAVLLRAAEPLEGIPAMQQLTGRHKLEQLANGPAKLTQCLEIMSNELSGQPFGAGTIELIAGDMINESNIVVARRIGISKAQNQPWRFYLKNNHFVSKLV